MASDVRVTEGRGASRAPIAASRTLGYQPGLDGLRGLALLAIVVFHSRVEGVPGAFLSVSTFFTLSGFLITTVVFRAYERDGRVGVRRFYERRARRLLPVALLAVASIVVLTALTGDVTQLARARGDALSSLFYVANWHLIRAGDSYGAIFDSPSMFTHFWTLAIEEQFYVVFPLVVALVLWAARGSRRVLTAVFVALVVASTAWSSFLLSSGAGIDRVYFGSDTRVGEIMLGVVFALWWLHAPELGPRWQRVVELAGLLALGVMLAAWHLADRTAPLFYRGGLLVYALGTLLVIFAVLQPAGPLRRMLSWRPLVLVGTISYSAYLLHWPILVLLQTRTAIPSWAQLVVGLTVTLTLAWLLYRWVENPVRTGTRLRAPWAQRVVVPAFAAVTVVILVATLSPAPPTIVDFAAASERVDALGAAPGASGGDPAKEFGDKLAKATPEERAQFLAWVDQSKRIAASTAPREAFFGDSTALMTGFGVADWSVDHLDRLAPAAGETVVGCGLLTDVRRVGGQDEGPPPDTCNGWLERWRAASTATTINIAVVQFGPWEVQDQQLGSVGPALVVGRDAALDQAIEAALDEAVTSLLEHVDVVVLLSSPDVSFHRVDGRDPPVPAAESDPARMAAFRAIEDRVARRHDRVGQVDLAGYLATRPDDARLRPDGVHFTEAGSREVGAWLGPEILATYERLRAPRGTSGTAPPSR